ncbi:MAG: DUF3892 domain-containing protein [Eubacterium sp.]|jgi:hypothetical protein|nr:DUF3892 domain-containing protein [Eubacterium sp.]
MSVKPKAGTLPLNAMSELPTPNANAKKITALQRSSGRVTGYQLEDGTTLNKADAVNLARQGGIRGVGIAKNKGSEYLKSIPDENGNNNLSHLPTMKL